MQSIYKEPTDHTEELPINPKIKVIFRGFIITRIKHGVANAMIGAHRNSSCHKPVVQVFKWSPPPGGDGRATEVRNIMIDLDQNFELVVENPSLPGIQVYYQDGQDFNRLDDENDARDFRWFVDFDDVHRKPVTVNTAMLHPQFTLNNGLFHSSNLSDENVRIQRYGQPSKCFGRYALEITARIYFEANSIAYFRNGGRDVIDPIVVSDGCRYEIVYDCNCRADPEEGDQGDWDLCYEVIGGLDPLDKIRLLPDTKSIVEANREPMGPRRNPEVFCTGGNHG